MSRMCKEDHLDYSEEHIIENLPDPFLTDCSPYLMRRFDEKLHNHLVDCYGENGVKICKVIIIGDVSVGKTCLVNRFCRKMFDNNYKSTIGVDFEVERFRILNVPYILQIWDTAGQERFKSIAQSYYRGANAVVIAFDLMNPDTLNNSQTWLKEAAQTFSDNIPFLFLVGTKRDLLKRYAYKNVELSATRMATQLNAEFWAVSSKTGKNIAGLFRRIAALTFVESLKNEIESGKYVKNIGTKLIALNAKEKSNNKAGHCTSRKCMK